MVGRHINMSAEGLTEIWEIFDFRTDLSHELVLTLEDEAKWFVQKNLGDSKEVPNYLDYIYFKAMSDVDENMITIIR